MTISADELKELRESDWIMANTRAKEQATTEPDHNVPLFIGTWLRNVMRDYKPGPAGRVVGTIAHVSNGRLSDDEVLGSVAYHPSITDIHAAAPQASPSPSPSAIGSVAAKVLAYDDCHEVAVELGYPSLTEALEDLERLKAALQSLKEAGEPVDIGAECEAAMEDARQFGRGFMVDGRRVTPDHIRLFSADTLKEAK